MPAQSQCIRLLAAATATGALDDSKAIIARARPLVGDLRKVRWLGSLAKKLSAEFG